MIKKQLSGTSNLSWRKLQPQQLQNQTNEQAHDTMFFQAIYSISLLVLTEQYEGYLIV